MLKKLKLNDSIRSDQISRSVVCDSLWPHESQHARPPCPSPTPRVHSDSRPMSQWCIQVFSNESVLHIRKPKYWSFSFSISSSIEYSGLISFRMDWLDLLVIQGTLKSLLQHHSSKASILWCSAFFIVRSPNWCPFPYCVIFCNIKSLGSIALLNRALLLTVPWIFF